MLHTSHIYAHSCVYIAIYIYTHSVYVQCVYVCINKHSIILYTVGLQDSLQNKDLSLLLLFPLTVWHGGIYFYIVCV